MPGAPRERVLSATDIRWTPFSSKEIVLPTAMSSSLVAGSRRPAVVNAADRSPVTRTPQVQLQFRAAAVPQVDAQISILPAVLDPHRRPDPLAPSEVHRGDFNLGILIAGECMRGPHVTRDPGSTGSGHSMGRDRHTVVRHIGPARAQAAIPPVKIIRGAISMIRGSISSGIFLRKNIQRDKNNAQCYQQPQRPKDFGPPAPRNGFCNFSPSLRALTRHSLNPLRLVIAPYRTTASSTAPSLPRSAQPPTARMGPAPGRRDARDRPRRPLVHLGAMVLPQLPVPPPVNPGQAAASCTGWPGRAP